MTTPSPIQLWLGAFTGFYRPTAADVKSLDVVSRFLYAARSVILVISAQAALIAGLLAFGDGKFHALEFIGVLAGLVIAHMLSNLLNDYYGHARGHDTPDSPRMRYTVHPLASGVLERRTFFIGLTLLAVLGCAIAGLFIWERGWTALAFAAAGTAILLLYDASPIPLKSIGLGEIATFIVWGPLMIGGGYAMIAGEVSVNAIYASVPYGLGVMSILTGKHIDQLSFDASRKLNTLPVLIGEKTARWFTLLSIVAMYVVVVALVAGGRLAWPVLLVAVALPRAVSSVGILSRPRPPQPPQGYVGWPLWYHRACLVHNRMFGWLYIAGLAAGDLLASI